MSQKPSLEQVYNLFFEDYPDVLTTAHLREILNISDKTLFRLLKSNKLRSIQVGKCYRVPKLFLLQYLEMLPKEKG